MYYEKLDHIPSSTIVRAWNTHNTLAYCCDYAYHIQDKVYTPHSFNLQQQNHDASQTRTNFLTDLELEASDNRWSISHGKGSLI